MYYIGKGNGNAILGFGFVFRISYFVFRIAYCDSKSPKYNKLYISFNSISFTKRNQIQANKGPPLWVLAKWRSAEVKQEEGGKVLEEEKRRGAGDVEQ